MLTTKTGTENWIERPIRLIGNYLNYEAHANKLMLCHKTMPYRRTLQKKLKQRCQQYPHSCRVVNSFGVRGPCLQSRPENAIY